ncbi:MAG: T9SS type A sorting domain-containing protein [Chryseolinea sp.]
MKRIIFCVLAILLFSNIASATHLRGGHISIKQLGKTSLTCRITITVYTNTNGTSVLFGGTKFEEGDLLDFGDGTNRVLVPEIGPGKNPPGSTYLLIDAARGVARATYTIEHVYTAPGRYLVSYREANRNEGIINMDQSVNTFFYIESSFTLDPSIDRAYASPNFRAEPIFRATSESGFSYSMAALDSNDYELLYELTTPKMEINQDVQNFKLPESFSINQFNGVITWNSKFQGLFRAGQYAYAVKVYQIKDNHVIGYTIRDFQIILDDDNFSSPISDNRDLDENNRIYIPTGNTYTFKVFAEDSEVTSLEVFSELSSHSNLFSFTSYDSTHDTQNIKVGVVSVTSSAELLRDNPYAIVVRGHYRSGTFRKDLGYLFYTKDIEIPGLDIILGASEEELSLNIYPNPAKDFLKIEGDGPKSKTIKLLSVNGQLILEKKNFKEDTLDLRGVPPGVYVLQIGSDGSDQKIFRIIKTN